MDYDSGDYETTLNRALELIDYNGEAIRDDVWWQCPSWPRRTNALPTVVGSVDDLNVFHAL